MILIAVIVGLFVSAAIAQTPVEPKEAERRAAMLREAVRFQAERLETERRAIAVARIKPPVGKILFRGPDGIYETGTVGRLRLVFPLPIRDADSHWVLSPDRQKAAYSSTRGVVAPEVPFVEILKRGQAEPHRVVLNVAIPKAMPEESPRGYEASVHAPGWSPDGKWLMVTTQIRTRDTYEVFTQLVRMTSAGENQTILVEDRSVMFGGWSPDGSCYAYSISPSTGVRTTVICRTDGSVVRTIAGEQGWWWKGWVPDGRYLSVGDVKVSAEQVIPPEAVDNGRAAWQPSSRQSLYRQASLESLDGTTRPLAVGPCSLQAFTWSADGGRVAFSRDVECVAHASMSFAQLVVVDIRKAKAICFPAVGGSQAPDYPLVWSPDGRYLLLWINGRETRNNLRILTFDGKVAGEYAVPFHPIAWVQ